MKNVQVKDLIFNELNTKICVPLTGTNDSQILNDIDNLKDIDFDLIELRIDYYEHVDDLESIKNLLEQIRKLFLKPILFTFRTKNEGGMYEISEDKYFSLCHFAIESKLIDLIDIELFNSEEKIKNIIAFAHKNDVRVIMSNHEFNKTPSKEEIIRRLVKMQDYDADITKIAVMANSEEDVLTLFKASLEMKKEKGDRPFIALSMGPMGVVTRLTGELFGSCLTFAALDKASAPGQLNVRNTREILNLLHVKK